ncbi:MAG: hypothetical protein JNM90_04825 [Burkholderiales bacterium]|nr:hypothetical protein [Burkholderiales bacterium]
MRLIDGIPLPLLVVVSLFMLGAPFVPEPHLLEKARLLAQGALTRPLDIVDVVWHLLPSALLVIRLVRRRRRG